MLEKIYANTKDSMEKALGALDQDLNRVRTGRASLSLLDGVRVNYYGTPTPVAQTASVAVPESRLITIAPWDTSLIHEIEKAILKSDLGLTPTNDGKVVRISIPPLTEARRKDLCKSVGKVGEEQKVAVRNIRRDANEEVKVLKKDSKISEDELFKAQEKIQKITDDYIKKVDETCAKKEKEILEF